MSCQLCANPADPGTDRVPVELDTEVWDRSCTMHSFEIVVNNVENGEILVKKGDRVVSSGAVVSPAIELNPFMFEAAKWAPDRKVSASGVNALHLSLEQLHAGSLPYGSIGMSIVPQSDAHRSLHQIQTSFLPGRGIFGEYSPTLLSGLEIEMRDGRASVIRIKSEKRISYVLLFDQKTGDVWVWREYWTRVGSIVKKVRGTGRFAGTEHLETGKIRAVHPGVICVSTSPQRQTGGFQIIPEKHANSSNLEFTWKNDAYMIVKSDVETLGEDIIFGGLVAPLDSALSVGESGVVAQLPDLVNIRTMELDSLMISNISDLDLIQVILSSRRLETK